MKRDLHQILWLISFVVFFAGGILVTFRPAYDYTTVKSVAGFLFSLFAAILLFWKKESFASAELPLYLFTAFSAWTLFSALTAPFWYGAAAALEPYLLFLLIFLVATQVGMRKEWLYLWLGSALVAEIIILIQHFILHAYSTSTFGNPNFFAGHAIMPGLLAMGLLFGRQKSSGERVFLVVCAAGSLLSLLYAKTGDGASASFTALFTPAGSRSAIVSFAIGAAVLVFLNLRRRNILVRSSGFMVIILAVTAAFPKIMTWITSDIRFLIWRGTWRMIQTKVLTGYGLGDYIFYYPYFRVKEYFLRPQATPITNHPHCEYLRIWAETGIIGLLLFIAVIVAALLCLRHTGPVQPPQPAARKKNKQQEETPLPVVLGPAIAAAVIAVCADNLFSTNLTNPSTAMYFWFLLGIAAGSHRGKTVSGKTISRILWSVTAIVSYVMAIFVCWYRITPDVFLKRAIWAKESNYMEEAVRNYSIVCNLNAYNYVAWYKLAYAYGQINKFPEAHAVYTHIQNHLFPHFAKTDMNLGTIYTRMGDNRKALSFYLWADWFNPYDRDILCSIASLYLSEYNDRATARGYLERVLTRDPANQYANTVLQKIR